MYGEQSGKLYVDIGGGKGQYTINTVDSLEKPFLTPS